MPLGLKLVTMMTKKTTVYLDPRGPAQKEEEEQQRQIDDQQKQERIKKGAELLSGFISYIIILPLFFMFSFNISLTKIFELSKIGYLESLGIVIMARILRGRND